MREKFARFISARYAMYGIDRFSWFLLALYVILSFISGFFTNVWVRLALRLVGASAVVYMVFRLLSKNIFARRKESAAFNKIWDKVKTFFKLQKDRIKDVKTYRYRRCSHCKAVLRLPVPKKKGKNTVVCPKCHERFSVFNLF